MTGRERFVPLMRLTGSLARRQAAWGQGKLSRFIGDRRGNVFIFTAIGAFALIGAAGLGTEAASWYASKRNMQNAADEAAQGGIKILYKAFLDKQNGISPACDGTAGWSAVRNCARKEALGATAYHGYTDGASNPTLVSITVNMDPSDANNVPGYPSPAYDNKVVEVYVAQPSDRLFSNIFLTTQQNINARAVAILDLTKADCLIALNPSSGKALSAQGSVTVNSPCGAAVASSSNNGFSTTGGAADLNIGNLRVSATGTPPVDDHNNDLGDTPVQKGETITDPYWNTTLSPPSRVMPTLASGYSTGSYPGNSLQTIPTPDAAHTITGNVTINSNTTTAQLFPSAANCISGCVIKGNLTIGNGSAMTLTLSTGVYFIDSNHVSGSGNLTINSNGTLDTSAGATIILTDSGATTTSNSRVGNFNMQSSTSNINMLAPSNTSGDPGYSIIQYGNNNAAYSSYASLAGIALTQDRLASESSVQGNGSCNSNCNTMYGGPTDTANGAFYFPQGNLTLQGTPNNSSCFQLVADTITLAGTGTLNLNLDNCTQGEILIGPQIAHLAE